MNNGMVALRMSVQNMVFRKGVVGLLLTGSVMLSGCSDVLRQPLSSSSDRPVFALGDDFSEITRHAEAEKTLPDMDMLLRVKLPPQPTKSEATNYVHMIYTLSRNQRAYLESDPQVGMLMAVGREHMDVLFEASRPGVPWVVYGAEAIRALAQPEDKQRIIQELAHNHNLASAVWHHDWCADARDTLVDLMKGRTGYLPRDVIRCLVKLEDPELYPVLITYMIEGWNSNVTYTEIKNLPGIKLRTALPKAWEASRGNKYQAAYLLDDVLAMGYLPAFHFLFETLDNNLELPTTVYDGYALAKRFTGRNGNREHLMAWYEKNKDNVYYDSKEGVFTAKRLLFK